MSKMKDIVTGLQEGGYGYIGGGTHAKRCEKGTVWVFRTGRIEALRHGSNQSWTRFATLDDAEEFVS